MVSRRGSLRWTVCERKFVSTRTEYGGTSAVLYWKKRDEETWGTWRVIASAAFFFSSMAGLSLRTSRASRWPMIRLTAPNFRVLLEAPMIVLYCIVGRGVLVVWGFCGLGVEVLCRQFARQLCRRPALARANHKQGSVYADCRRGLTDIDRARPGLGELRTRRDGEAR